MDCNVIKDLIPLYIDGCCSKESENIVKEHLEFCNNCKEIYENMKAPAVIEKSIAPEIKINKLNEWKASIIQSILLFVSFAIITIGVALEAYTPSGIGNGFAAINLVIPATGFMLSLANWYFIRLYKTRKLFSDCCLYATISITTMAYIWASFHYGMNLFMTPIFEVIPAFFLLHAIGIILTLIFCILSKKLSDKYGKLVGKE